MKRKYAAIFVLSLLMCFHGHCGAEEERVLPDEPAVAMSDDMVRLAQRSEITEHKVQAPEPKMTLNNFARTPGKLDVNKIETEDSENKIILDDDATLTQPDLSEKIESEDDEKETEEDDSKSAESLKIRKLESPQKVRVLSPELKKLKDQLQGVLAANEKRTLSTQGNTPAEIIAYSFVYGADAKVNHLVAPQPQPNQRGPRTLTPTPIYAVGSLCWNYPSGGKTLLRVDDEKVLAKVGPGTQRKASTFLAMLAMASIAEKYEIRIGDFTGTVADLVKAEKAYCSDDADMSLTLVGLSFYCNCEEEWTNEFGETWSIPKMVLSELYRPADQGTSNMTDQLLGLSCAVRRFENEGFELNGAMLDAKKYLMSFRDFSLSAQNDQGLWHPRFFLFRGNATNPWDSLYSGGHIFRFLAFEIPENRLADARMTRTAKSLADLIQRTAATPPATERQWEALMTSLHALAIYKERLDSTYGAE